MVTSPAGTLAADGAADGGTNGTSATRSDGREKTDDRIGDAARTTRGHRNEEHGMNHTHTHTHTLRYSQL